MAVALKLTFADVLALPDDGTRYELLDGELIVAASPFTRHQRVSKRLEHVLSMAELAGYGEVWYAPFVSYSTSSIPCSLICSLFGPAAA